MNAVQLDKVFDDYCKTRDVSLRNELVEEHLYIADMVARRYAGRGIDYDDLYQVASLALIGALERFDCSKGLKFSSFAVPTLMGVVKNHFRDKSRAIRMPRRLSENVRQVESAKEELMQKLGHQPDLNEIAEGTGLSREQVLEAMEARLSLQMTSLDAGVGPDDDGSLLAMLGEEEDAYEKIAISDLLNKELAKLSEMERHILSERFIHMKTQRQVAGEIGVSQMYVSRLERKLLQRLKDAILQA